jgi:SAM-dependent methyltransferase
LSLELSLHNSSLQLLRDEIARLKTAVTSCFDANIYYNTERVTAYTSEFQDVQFRHTSRCVFLLGYLPPFALFLDLGCGSGLSTKRLRQCPGFSVGLDVSEAMLDAARVAVPASDFILADFNNKLPFRQAALDYGSSTSALHYVHAGREGLVLAELERVVQQAVAVQLFCQPTDNGAGVAELRRRWCETWTGEAKLFVDRPHHKHDRMYLRLAAAQAMPGDASELSCTCTSQQGTCSVFPDFTHCLLQFAGDWRTIEDGHQNWLMAEHGRFVRRSDRVQKRKLHELSGPTM